MPRKTLTVVALTFLCHLGLAWGQSNNAPAPGKGFTFRALLEDASGGPISGVTVQIEEWNGLVLGTAVTESDGSFAVRDLEPSLYWISGNYRGRPFRQTVNFSNPQLITEVQLDIPSPPRTVASGNPAGDVVSVGALSASPEARKNLDKARKALAGHQITRAFALSGAAIAGAPRWAEPYFFRGVLHMDQHEYREAIQDLNSSLDNKPQDPLALAALGTAMQHLGRFRLALNYLDYANRIKPVWQAYFTRAQIDLSLHRPTQAIQDAGQALSLDPPGPPQCHLLRANGDLELRNFADAARELQIFLTLSPNAAEASQARSVLHAIHRVAPTEAGRP